jgi:DNA-binding NarL/FixJ family response regulator
MVAAPVPGDDEPGSGRARTGDCRARSPNVIVALRHARLRNAIARELDSSACLSVVGQAGDLATATAIARRQHADGMVVGIDLLRDGLVASTCGLVASLPGIRIVVVGTDPGSAYARALEVAGASAYVSLQWGADVLATSVLLALRHHVH